MPGDVCIGNEYATKLKVGISAEARRRSTYIIGKPGSGKSTLLENIAVQDMENGDGFCMLDPHGESANLLMAAVPPTRRSDVIYWNPRDIAHPFGLNPFYCTNRDDALEVDQRVEHFLSALSSLEEFTEVFASAPRMTDILRHLAFAFVLNEGATLTETPRFLTNGLYRAQFYPAIERFGRYDIVEYWQAFDAIRLESRREELTASSLNKLRRLTTTTILRLIFGQATPSINFREVMDTRKIVIVNLHELGQGNADVIGAFVVWEILAGAYSRGEINAKQRQPFHLILDEFQKFSSTAVPQLIEECRKYAVDTIIAHQHRRQLEGKTLGATLTAPNRIVLQVTGEDADLLAREFTIKVPEPELVPQVMTEPVMESYIDETLTSPEIAQAEDALVLTSRELREAQTDMERATFERKVLDECFVVLLAKKEPLVGLDVLEEKHGGLRWYHDWVDDHYRSGRLTREQYTTPELMPDDYWIYRRPYRYVAIYRTLNPQFRKAANYEHAKRCAGDDYPTMRRSGSAPSFPTHIPTLAEERLDQYLARENYYRTFLSDTECRSIVAGIRDEFLALFLPLKATAVYRWDIKHLHDYDVWERDNGRTHWFVENNGPPLSQWYGGPIGGGVWELTEFPEVLDWLQRKVRAGVTRQRELDMRIRQLKREIETLKATIVQLRTRQRYLGYDRVVKDIVDTKEQPRYIKREGSQRSIEDIANELANELANFPPFVARCKIGTVEWKLQTRGPVQVGDAQWATAEKLKARSAATFGRDRATVEAEIARRRQTSAAIPADATMDGDGDDLPSDQPAPNLSDVFKSPDI
jgi:hypothetical protein